MYIPEIVKSQVKECRLIRGAKILRIRIFQTAADSTSLLIFYDFKPRILKKSSSLFLSFKIALLAISRKFLSRISDPDRGGDHDHGSDDVIVIEDFLFRELLLRGRCLAPQPRRCAAFPFMNSVFLLRWELFDLEWEVKASRNGLHKRSPVREYVCHTRVAYQGQFDFIARYRPIVKVYICKWDMGERKRKRVQKLV